MREIIAAKPERVLCLDGAFEGNDQLKTNIVLQMRDAKFNKQTFVMSNMLPQAAALNREVWKDLEE